MRPRRHIGALLKAGIPASVFAPSSYDRPWHLDHDDRRHKGRRAWEPEALDAIVRLLADIGWVYPPDYSRRDAIVFRVSGASARFLTVKTARAACLQLIFELPGSKHRNTFAAPLGDKKPQLLKSSRGLRRVVELSAASQVNSAAFAEFIHDYAKAFASSHAIHPAWP